MVAHAESPRHHLPISWDQIQKDAALLAEQLARQGRWQGIVAVARGGLVPAALVSRSLGIRRIETVSAVLYEGDRIGEPELLKFPAAAGDGSGWLVIDDLVDTGRTAQAVRQLLPKAYFATLYAKPAGRSIVDTFVKEFKQTKWIHFPWDIEYSFATPIKDGGRAIAGP